MLLTNTHLLIEKQSIRVYTCAQHAEYERMRNYPAIRIAQAYRRGIRNTKHGNSVSRDTRYAHLSWKVPYSNSTIQFDRIGDVVICHGNVKFTASGQCNYSKADEILPKGYRPTEANVPVVFSINGRFAIFFGSDGTVTMLGNPNNDYACCTGSWYTKDDFPA